MQLAVPTSAGTGLDDAGMAVAQGGHIASRDNSQDTELPRDDRRMSSMI
jgi:hypothetical protein